MDGLEKEICVNCLGRSLSLSLGWLGRSSNALEIQQGRIHGNLVADGWAGAVMRKPLGIQKCDRPTDRRTDGPTDQGVELRVRD